MNKIIIVLLFFLLISFKGYTQNVKAGKNKHPVLGNIMLKKVYEKDEDGVYSYLVGKGTYSNKAHGKITYEITYDGDDRSFLVWEEFYQDSLLGKVTIKRWPQFKYKEYTDIKGGKVQQRIRYSYTDTDTIHPLEIYNFIDGEEEGKQYDYDSKGNLYRIENYKKGIRQGPYEIYYENKQVKEKGSYTTKQRLDGELITFNKSGDTIQFGTFINGKRIGVWRMKRYSSDRFYEFKSKCIYNEDSVFCEEREYYIEDKSNDLRTIKTFKKVNEYKRYLENNSYDEFGHIKHGLYRKLYQGKVLEEGQYNNSCKSGRWKTYHNNGNVELDANYITIESEDGYLKSVNHGTWKYYNKDGEHTDTFRYYNGKRIENVELSVPNILGGIFFIIAIVFLIMYNKRILELKIEENNQLNLSKLLIIVFAILIFVTSIEFLENTVHSIFNVEFGWTRVIIGTGLSYLVSLSILFSLKQKPIKKVLFLGLLGYAFTWVLFALLGCSFGYFFIYIIGVFFPIYDDETIIWAAAFCTACFFGLLFIHKYWKIKNNVNYLYFFIVSLIINIVFATILITQPSFSEILSNGDEITIFFILNYLICSIQLSFSSINDFKYTKKIKNSFLAFIISILIFSVFLSIYKYIDPFETDCEKYLDRDKNVLENISDRLEKDAKKLNDKYEQEYGIKEWFSIKYFAVQHKKEIDEKLGVIDEKIEKLTKEIQKDYDTAKEANYTKEETLDCSLFLRHYKELTELSKQRADELFELYKIELHKKFEEKSKK